MTYRHQVVFENKYALFNFMIIFRHVKMAYEAAGIFHEKVWPPYTEKPKDVADH